MMGDYLKRELLSITCSQAPKQKWHLTHGCHQKNELSHTRKRKGAGWQVKQSFTCPELMSARFQHYWIKTHILPKEKWERQWKSLPSWTLRRRQRRPTWWCILTKIECDDATSVICSGKHLKFLQNGCQIRVSESKTCSFTTYTYNRSVKVTIKRAMDVASACIRLTGFGRLWYLTSYDTLILRFGLPIKSLTHLCESKNADKTCWFWWSESTTIHERVYTSCQGLRIGFAWEISDWFHRGKFISHNGWKHYPGRDRNYQNRRKWKSFTDTALKKWSACRRRKELNCNL